MNNSLAVVLLMFAGQKRGSVKEEVKRVLGEQFYVLAPRADVMSRFYWLVT